MSPSRDIQLTTDDGRLLLRPAGIEDASALYEAVRASMDELMPWMDWCRPGYTIDDTKKWLRKLPEQWQEGQSFGFAIVDAASGQILGSCGLGHINSSYRIANLGYWVRSDRTGEGIATEAARQVAQFGFRELGLVRIEIVAAVENWASRRVAEKTGAHFEGILRKRLKIGDKNVDAAMHSLVPEDFSNSLR